MESDFDLSQSKLKQLGGDLSSLHIVDQQTPQDGNQNQDLEMKSRFNDFSRSVLTYARKFESGDSTNQFSKIQDQSDISMRMEHFRKKIQDIQHDLESQHTKSPTSDPYKISLHSIQPVSKKRPFSSNNKFSYQDQNQDQYQSYNSYGNQMQQETQNLQAQNQRPKNQQSQNQFSYTQQQKAQYSQNQSSQNYQSQKQQPFYSSQNQNQNYNNTSSVSSGGLSFKPPNLYSTSNKKPPIIKADHLTELELHRIKYYDSYMPEGYRMMNCPYKLLKHKLQNRNKDALTRCLEDFNLMDLELTSSLR